MVMELFGLLDNISLGEDIESQIPHN